MNRTVMFLLPRAFPLCKRLEIREALVASSRRSCVLQAVAEHSGLTVASGLLLNLGFPKVRDYPMGFGNIVPTV